MTTLKMTLMASLFMVLLTIGKTGYSQESPPPPSEHGTSGNRAPGGGAPLEGGLVITLVLAAAYGTRNSVLCKQKSTQKPSV